MLLAAGLIVAHSGCVRLGFDAGPLAKAEVDGAADSSLNRLGDQSSEVVGLEFAGVVRLDGLLDAGGTDRGNGRADAPPGCVVDRCGECDTDPTNDCAQDCADDWGGSAVVDACGTCVGRATGLTACPTLTLEPSADAYVREDSPSTYYGQDPSLLIQPENRTGTSYIYLRFDLRSLPAGATVRGVSLRASAFRGYAYGGDGRVYTHHVKDDTWSETKINWNNMPAAEDPACSVTACPLGFWFLWYDRTPVDKTGINENPDLIPLVQAEFGGDGMVSFRLRSLGYYTEYRSREYGSVEKRPTLTVGYLQ